MPTSLPRGNKDRHSGRAEDSRKEVLWQKAPPTLRHMSWFLISKRTAQCQGLGGVFVARGKINRTKLRN
jgi:hypothetical protein